MDDIASSRDMCKIYYARHVHDWEYSKGTVRSPIEYLFNHKAIAIHFAPVESWNPAHYRNQGNQGRSAVEYMNRCNENAEECYIFASYKIGGNNRILRGAPKRGSKKFLREFTGAPEELPLKLLFLENTVEVTLEDFPLAHLLAPKQQTFVRWHACEKIANSYINGEPLDVLDPDSYLPWGLEVLCEEYLRLRGYLRLKLYECGGTLKDFDIIGIGGDNKRIFSQVKNRASAHQIRAFTGQRRRDSDDIYIFFCKQDCIPVTRSEDCVIIALEEVLVAMLDACGESYLGKVMMASF